MFVEKIINGKMFIKTGHYKLFINYLNIISNKMNMTPQKYYLKHYYRWDIDHDTRRMIEYHLDLITKYNAPICECNEEYWMCIEQLIYSSQEFFDNNGYISHGTVRENINNLLKPACEKYNINIYDLVIISKSLSVK